MLVLLLVVLTAAGVALWADDAEQVSLDEPFTLTSRFNSFANPEYFGSVKVRGRRIEVRIDSLRVSVYEPQVWNDLSVRARARHVVDLWRVADELEEALWVRVRTDPETLAPGLVEQQRLFMRALHSR